MPACVLVVLKGLSGRVVTLVQVPRVTICENYKVQEHKLEVGVGGRCVCVCANGVLPSRKDFRV